MSITEPPPPNQFRSDIYSKADPLLRQLSQDPKNKGISEKLGELNRQLLDHDPHEVSIEVKYFADHFELGHAWRKKAKESPQSKIFAEEKMLALNAELKNKATQAGYPSSWGDLMLTDEEQQQVKANPAPGSSPSDPPQLAAKDSSSDRKIRDKSVAFDYIKKEPDDAAPGPPTLFIDDDDDTNDDQANGNVTTKDELDDGYGIITPPRQAPKGPSGEDGVLEAYCLKPDMAIMRYGPRNAPIYRWRRGPVPQDGRDKALDMKKRKLDDKLDGNYKYTADDIMGIQGACWSWNEAEYENFKNDPYGLRLINPAKVHKRFPQTLCKISWQDGTKTWETRTGVRRLYGNGHKYADRKIYENMRLHVDRYVEHKTGRRPALSRSPTPFVTGSRRSTPSDELRPKTRSQGKAKESKPTQKRNPLRERSDKGNARASSKGSSRKPGTNMKTDTLSLKEFAEMWQDSLPSANRKGGMAKITREWQQYVQDTKSAEHEQDASSTEDSANERVNDSTDEDSGSESDL